MVPFLNQKLYIWDGWEFLEIKISFPVVQFLTVAVDDGIDKWQIASWLWSQAYIS